MQADAQDLSHIVTVLEAKTQIAAGDLALRESARALYSLNDRPNEAALRRMARDWSPWRGVAARALWAYYRVIKNREGSI